MGKKNKSGRRSGQAGGAAVAAARVSTSSSGASPPASTSTTSGTSVLSKNELIYEAPPLTDAPEWKPMDASLVDEFNTVVKKRLRAPMVRAVQPTPTAEGVVKVFGNAGHVEQE
ncbi:hypothetical protein HDU97_002410 [Phlyctochytrium planicorne]|nr:hypothetical protein HDU97_002410 [Phlyctochytrium planicorne]